MRDGTNAAVAVVPRLFMAMVLGMDGAPGAVMDQVQQPEEIAAGISLRERSEFLNICRAMG